MWRKQYSTVIRFDSGCGYLWVMRSYSSRLYPIDFSSDWVSVCSLQPPFNWIVFASWRCINSANRLIRWFFWGKGRLRQGLAIEFGSLEFLAMCLAPLDQWHKCAFFNYWKNLLICQEVIYRCICNGVSRSTFMYWKAAAKSSVCNLKQKNGCYRVWRCTWLSPGGCCLPSCWDAPVRISTVRWFSSVRNGRRLISWSSVVHRHRNRPAYPVFVTPASLSYWFLLSAVFISKKSFKINGHFSFSPVVPSI